METGQQPPLKEPPSQPSEASINNVIQFPNKPETLEQPDQEVFSALELKLDEANTNAQGNLFVKIGTVQPDESHVYARFFDAAHDKGKYLIEVSGQGFRVLETPDDPTGGINNAITRQREWTKTGQKPTYIGDVQPGHITLPDGTEQFILPNSYMGSNKDDSSIKYRPATQQDIEELLPLNAQAVEYRNLEQIKERQEQERKDAANITRKVLPNINALLAGDPNPKPPTLIAQPIPIIPAVA